MHLRNFISVSFYGKSVKKLLIEIFHGQKIGHFH